MDLSWILDEEWGVYDVTFEGKKELFLLAFKRKREGGRQITC